MGLYDENNCKVCLERFSVHSDTKSTNKIFFFVFSRKNPDFPKKNLKNSKIHFFELRNPVGWVPHAVLALDQWIRPKNRGSKKTVPQM